MAVPGFANAGVIFVARDVDKFIRSFSKINNVTQRFNKNIGNAVKTWNNFETQMTVVGSRVINGLVTGLAALTIALGAVSAAGISTAASFENAFADVTKTVDAFIDRAATAEMGVIQLTEAGAEFRQALKDLSGEIPVTFERLSAIAGLGGQLGIINELAGDEAKEALLSFTETVAGLAEATNLTQEKAATGLAQISNIYRTSIDDIGDNIERLGSTIVHLGNTSATTESLILNFTQRIAGAGKTVGLTQAEVLGIGTAFASIGITAEAGSTAVNRALLIINEAVANSTDQFLDNTSAIMTTQDEISDLSADLVRLEAQIGEGEGFGEALVAQRDAWIEAGNAAEDFGRTLGDARREQLFQTQSAIDRLTQRLNVLKITQGQAVTTEVFDELLRVVQNTAKGAEVTAEAFRDLFVEDPAEAFTLFIEGLAEEGERAGEVLDRIGLGSVEATRAFLAIAGASETVRAQIESAIGAFEENQALVDEVSIRYATLTSTVKEFINVIRGVTDTLFAPLIGPLIAFLEQGKEIAQVFGTDVPAIISTLADKLAPELAEINEAFFGTAEDEETQTLAERISAGLNALNESIEAMDFSGLSDAVIGIRDTIVPIFNKAMSLATEHADALMGALKGLSAILTGAALFAAFRRASFLVTFLNTPLGVATASAIALGAAWETNFLKIQDVTESVVSRVQESWSGLVSSLQAIELPELFPETGIIGGPEIITPEGFVISGDLIGIDPTFEQRLASLGESIAAFIGDVVTLVATVPLEQIRGIIDMVEGFINIGEGLTAEQLPIAKTLAGVEEVIDGFFDAVTAPIRTLSEVFGLEDFIGDLRFEGLRDILTDAAQDLAIGFIQGFTGIDIEGLGTSFTDLLDQIGELAESINFSALTEGIGVLISSLIELSGAFKELVGLKPDDSLLVFVGEIVGFLAKVGVDQLIAIVDGITGLVTALTGLFNLDADQIVQGLKQIGTATIDFLIAPFTNIAERLSPEFKLQMAQLALDGLAAFEESWDEGFVTLEQGQTMSQWLMGISESITDFFTNLVANVQDLAAINLDVEDFIDLQQLDQDITDWLNEISIKFANAVFSIVPTTEDLVALDTEITTWLDNISAKFTKFVLEQTLDFIALFPSTENIDTFIGTIRDKITGIWDDIDPGVPSFLDLAQELLVVQTQVKDLLSGIWSDVDLGIPSFESLMTAISEVGKRIRDFFSGLFEGFDLDFGIIDKLAELGLIDVEVEAPDTDGLGTDLAQGLVDEVEAAEQTWQEAWLDFLLAPIELGKELLGTESPSTVTMEMGQDVIEGYAIGLSDLTPIEQAIIGVDNLILNAFSTLTDELLSRTIPTIRQTDAVFTAFYSDTLSRTVGVINDELIPAKLELTEVNLNDLIPSVDDLIQAEEQLADTLDRVVNKLRQMISASEKAKDRSKSLTKEIDKLAEAYLTLAAAIGSASKAGDGLTSAPAGPAGPEFQSGGSFVVPSNVGLEGMPIRVHAGELVQIIPANVVPKLRGAPLELERTAMKSPLMSGAQINNMVSNQVNNSENKEFHLHVAEAPSSDVRDSFDLLEVLS